MCDGNIVMTANEWYAIACGLLTFVCVLRWLTWRNRTNAHDVEHADESPLRVRRQGLDFNQWMFGGVLKVNYERTPVRAIFSSDSITRAWQSDVRETSFSVPDVRGVATGTGAHGPVRVRTFQGAFSTVRIWRC